MAGETKRSNERRLDPEQQEFVLDCLACRMSYNEIRDYLDEEFGIKGIARSAITYYKRHYAEDIARRRADWHKNLKLSNLPFVAQCERIGRYGRFAKIEMNRKRYKDAADHMRRIAEETGDLKVTENVNHGVQDSSSAELLGVVQGALERINARGADSGGGAGQEDGPCAGKAGG